MKWKMMKLREIADVKAGGTPSRRKIEYWENGKIPWIKIKDINCKYVKKNEEYITELGLNKSSAKLFQKGTILFTIFATLGEVAILDFDASTNQAIAGIKTLDSNIIENEYLYFYLKSIKKSVVSSGRGVAQNNINLGILRDYEVLVPPIEIQRKVAKALNKAQELIDKRKDQIEKLDEFVQSVFLDMFGDPVNNPKGWRIEKFCKIANIVAKSTLPSYEDQNTVYIGLEHIAKESGEILEKNRIKELELKSNKYKFNDEMILYGKLRPYLNKVAIPDFEGICSTDIYPILPQGNFSDKFFLSYLMRHKYFVNYATQKSTGANLPRVSKKALESVNLYCPPLDLQNKFASIVKKTEKQKELLQKSLIEMENNFNSLMQKAFKGELF